MFACLPAAAISTSSSSRCAKGRAPSAMDHRLRPKLQMSPLVLHRRWFWLLMLALVDLLVGAAAAPAPAVVSK